MHGTIMELIDAIIEAAPNVGPALEEVTLAVADFRSGVGHLSTAATIISGRSSERDVSAELTDEEKAKIAELEGKLPDGRRGLLSDLFSFLKANPEILQFILLFLKK